MSVPNTRAPGPGPLARLLAPLLVVPVFVGCSGGDELPREAVSGTITFDGQPLTNGRILFEPAGEQATGGGAVISDGSYAIDRATGLVPGTYRVAISSGEAGGGAAAEAPGAPGEMMKEQIPAKYNSASELTAEVTEDGDNTFDFELLP